MKKLLLFLLIFLSACSADVEPQPPVTKPATVESVTSAPPTPTVMDAPDLDTFADKFALWTQGTQLRGANIYQRRVYPELDGANFMGADAVGPPYTQADFDALAAAGANYVNFSVPGLFSVSPPYVLDQDVQDKLDELLAMAEKADLFVVISARTGPGRSEFSILRDGAGEWFDEKYLIESVWEDETAQKAWAEMWQYTAERYKDNPIVVGYDLMVEPNADDILETWDQDEFLAQYGGTGYDWNSWFPSIVDAIRQVDSETPILVGGMGYSSLDWLAYTTHVDDERTVYTFHQYEPFLYTHQSADEIENTYPGFFDADWDGEPDEVDDQWLENYLYLIGDFQIRTTLPTAVNECGVIRWEPNAADFMRDQWNLFEQRGINYAVWMWYPAWEPLAEGDNDFNFRFGENPANLQDVENSLFDVYKEFWAKNTLRPSNYVEKSQAGNWLKEVKTWLYLLDVDLRDETITQIADSDYDMVVLDFIPSERENADFPMAALIERLHNAPHPKKVIAYIDIGEAESYRTYWQDDWRVGNPAWITGDDPDGWAENYPVAFWAEEWQTIWLADGGMLDQIHAAGFDGVYLDWVEAYSDENVANAAIDEGVNPIYAMIEFVSLISAKLKSDCPDCVIIAQNAAELVEYPEYAATIDGLAQEQIWFDGGADNDPEGDCPLPRTDAEIDSETYYNSLSPECQRQFDEYPESTLHISSEELLFFVKIAQEKGIPIFTADYALQPENVAWIYKTSREHGFIPFVGNRGLDRFFESVP